MMIDAEEDHENDECPNHDEVVRQDATIESTNQMEMNRSSNHATPSTTTTSSALSSVRSLVKMPSSLQRDVSQYRRQSFVPYDISYHPGFQVCYFAPPRQRQRWGDTQILPRVNWGDLFFDLFYVAAAYNAVDILVSSPSNQGLLYFLGTFLPVLSLWADKLYYDARFAVGDDVFHRVFEFAVLCVLATTVVFIRPVEILSSSSHYVDMFGFSTALFCARLLTMARYMEVYWFGEGQPVITIAAQREISSCAVSTVGFGVAAIVAGIAFYDDTESSSINHVPIIVILSSYVGCRLCFCFHVIFCFPSGGRHKEISVPLNIDFIIHRTGEWIMLMLGTSILSLLTVGVEEEGTDYLLTFYAAVLSVILLQYLHFRSQPRHADQHAMRRHKNAGIGFSFFCEVYSSSLIVLGSMYKLLVASFAQTTTITDGGQHRTLVGTFPSAAVMVPEHPRLLSSSEGLPPLHDEAVQQRVANLFCGSLTIIMLCLDAKFMLHLGWKDICRRLEFGKSKKANVKGVFLIVAKVLLLVFTATISLYETKPERLTLIGLAVICVKLILRGLGGHYFPSEHDHHDHHHHQHPHQGQHHEIHQNKNNENMVVVDQKHQNENEGTHRVDISSGDNDLKDQNDCDMDYQCENLDDNGCNDKSDSDSDFDEEEEEDLEGHWPNVTTARAKHAVKGP